MFYIVSSWSLVEVRPVQEYVASKEFEAPHSPQLTFCGVS